MVKKNTVAENNEIETLQIRENRYMSTFASRLKIAMGDHTLKEFIELCDEQGSENISLASLRGYLRQESEPSRPRLITISEASGFSLEWLITGRGNEKKVDEGIVVIDTIEKLIEWVEGDPDTTLLKLCTPLDDHFSGTGCWLKLWDDNFEPKATIGDMVLIDTKKRKPGYSPLLVAFDDRIAIRRLHDTDHSDRFALYCENHVYQPILRKKKDVLILGTVVEISHREIL